MEKIKVIDIVNLLKMFFGISLLFEYVFENRDCRGLIIGILFGLWIIFIVIEKILKQRIHNK